MFKLFYFLSKIIILIYLKLLGGCVCYDEAFVQNGECVASCGSNYFVTVGSKIC